MNNSFYQFKDLTTFSKQHKFFANLQCGVLEDGNIASENVCTKQNYYVLVFDFFKLYTEITYSLYWFKYYYIKYIIIYGLMI